VVLCFVPSTVVNGAAGPAERVGHFAITTESPGNRRAGLAEMLIETRGLRAHGDASRRFVG